MGTLQDLHGLQLGVGGILLLYEFNPTVQILSHHREDYLLFFFTIVPTEVSCHSLCVPDNQTRDKAEHVKICENIHIDSASVRLIWRTGDHM